MDGERVAEIVSTFWEQIKGIERGGEKEEEEWGEMVAREIVREAVEKGAEDNLTVLVVEIWEGGGDVGVDGSDVAMGEAGREGSPERKRVRVEGIVSGSLPFIIESFLSTTDPVLITSPN